MKPTSAMALMFGLMNSGMTFKNNFDLSTKRKGDTGRGSTLNKKQRKVKKKKNAVAKKSRKRNR